MTQTIQAAKEIIVDWINAGSVIDTGSAIRGNDSFAFSDLRKGGGIFPKVHVTSNSRTASNHRAGTPIGYDTETTFFVWFYTKQSRNPIYLNYKNEALVEHWLDGIFRDAILGSANTIPGLYSPRVGEFSGVEIDPSNPELYRGFIPVSFKRLENYGR